MSGKGSIGGAVVGWLKVASRRREKVCAVALKTAALPEKFLRRGIGIVLCVGWIVSVDNCLVVCLVGGEGL